MKVHINTNTDTHTNIVPPRVGLAVTDTRLKCISSVFKYICILRYITVHINKHANLHTNTVPLTVGLAVIGVVNIVSFAGLFCKRDLCF